MLRTGSVHRDEGEVDVCLHYAGKVNLCLLSCIFQTLHSRCISGQINALGLLEFCYHPIYNLVVEVVAAQTVVAAGSQNLNYASADLQQRYVECTAAQVVYQYLLAVFFIQTIRKRSSRRLVYNTKNFQTCYLTCVLRSLALSVGEISRNCNYSLSYCFSEICLCISLQFGKYHCGYFLRAVGFAVDSYASVSTHIALDRRNRAVVVCYSLTLSDLTYQTLAVLSERYYRSRSTRAFRVRDYRRLAAFHYCYTAICCT